MSEVVPGLLQQQIWGPALSNEADHDSIMNNVSMIHCDVQSCQGYSQISVNGVDWHHISLNIISHLSEIQLMQASRDNLQLIKWGNRLTFLEVA